MSCSCLLLLSLINLWIHRSVSECLDNPVFTPPSLLVKYGDPASAICSVCKEDCLGTKFGLEKAVGTIEINGTDIIWEVESLTEWGTSLLCYYNHKNGAMCLERLKITLYQPPVNVSIGFVHGDGPLLAGQVYTLQCTVHKVAPLSHLIVTFYRGSEALDHRNFSSSEEQAPVSPLSTFSFNAREEDDGAQYWCEARLDIDVQQVTTVSSQRVSAVVHYKPRLISSSHPANITVKSGYPLKLNCLAVGQPPPSFVWTRASNATPISNTSIYSVKSVSKGDEGRYTCSVSNSMGMVAVHFTVQVQVPIIYITLAILAGVFVIVFIIVLIVYKIYHKHNNTGHFNLMKFQSNYKAATPASA